MKLPIRSQKSIIAEQVAELVKKEGGNRLELNEVSEELKHRI